MYTIQEIACLINGELVCNSNQNAINHYSIDSRSIKNGVSTLFFALSGKNRDGHDYINELIEKGARNFIVTKPIENQEVNYILVPDVLLALQNFATKHRAKYAIPVIGITGSHGKTIVKEWLSQLLSPDYVVCKTPKSYNSQIGVPLSVLTLHHKHTIAVFEAGISQTGEMEKLAHIIKPTIGVFTGLGDAHQANFSSYKEKKQEKYQLFKHLEDVYTNQTPINNYVIPFSDKASVENINVCIALLEGLGYEKEIIQKRIKTLSPLALRMEMVDGINGNTILNDSYNISFSGLVIAIDYLISQAGSKQKVLVISDILNYDYTTPDLVELIQSSKLNVVITVGKHKLPNIKGIVYHHFLTTQDVVKLFSELAIYNSYVLVKGARAFNFERIIQSVEGKKHQTKLEVNLAQIEQNLKNYRNKLLPSTKLMVMVKAFAYGNGTAEIPKLLAYNGVDYLGVAYTDEGVNLREKGVTIPIMVMNPEPDNFDLLIQHQLEPEIYSLTVLDEFIRTLILHQQKDYPIHIKLDTGMNRLGFKPKNDVALLAQLKAQPEVYVKSVFSHLSSADKATEKEFTQVQITQFDKRSSNLINGIGYPVIRHILNTSGMEAYPQHQFNMVRLGIGLYGINAAINDVNIQPVSALLSVVIQLKNIKKGESVGYGRSFIASQDMKIAIVPVGYADGIRRSLSNGKGSFFIAKQEAPIVGNVCMDLTMIDVSNIECKVGDEVEVFGKNQSVEDLAKKMDTIPYEVLTSVSQRVKRVFVKE